MDNECLICQDLSSLAKISVNNINQICTFIF